MAGIKSTMDLVMERAARMGVATPEEMRHEKYLKKGKQYSADYLNGQMEDLLSVVLQQEKEGQKATREGMLDSLLRNLFLPREDGAQQRIDRALQGIIALNATASEVGALCKELQNMLGQYGETRKQLYEQLKEQMRRQIEQLIMQKTGRPADGMRIDPTVEPRFKEEWARLEQEMDSQYGQALEQCKIQLREWTMGTRAA